MADLDRQSLANYYGRNDTLVHRCITIHTVWYTIHNIRIAVHCDSGRQNIIRVQYTFNANHTCLCIDKIVKYNVRFPHVYLTIIYVKSLHYYFFNARSDNVTSAVVLPCPRDKRVFFCCIILVGVVCIVICIVS